MHSVRPTLATVPVSEAARQYAELFPQVYRALCRIQHLADSKITPQGWALLQRLEYTGPLTVQELTGMLGRAQSAVSEMVAGLVRAGRLRRVKDPDDRRRTLVWLTDAGLEFLHRQRDVLDRERLTLALAKMSARERRALLDATRGLLQAAAGAQPDGSTRRPSIRRAGPPNRKSHRKHDERKRVK